MHSLQVAASGLFKITSLFKNNNSNSDTAEISSVLEVIADMTDYCEYAVTAEMYRVTQKLLSS